jgi:hypothetical protein
MTLEKMHFFNRQEKIAILKLIIKIAAADNKFTKEERIAIKEYLKINQLKISKDFATKVMNERFEDIVSAFKSKSNINKAYAIVKKFANSHRINPDFEGRVLDEIQNALEQKKQNIKVGFGGFVKEFFLEFSFLWGKEDINPKAKTILAIIFTVIACGFGTFWTKISFWGFGGGTEMVWPGIWPVLSGLLIFSTLCFRNFLPKPNNFRNILFFLANTYLLSTMAMHIIGRSPAEMTTTITLFLALIILLWLGMKEILGFVFIGFFGLLIYKIIAIDAHISWRAFPFLISAFMGISFQSENFFDEFGQISSSFFKKPEIEKELVNESLQLAGARVKKVAKAAVSVGAAAAGMPPGATAIAKSNPS